MEGHARGCEKFREGRVAKGCQQQPRAGAAREGGGGGEAQQRDPLAAWFLEHFKKLLDAGESC